MKVGTDGVLLGAWTKIGDAKQILDIGTGTGLIALMLAQRSGNSIIDAIEMDEDACLQASENVQRTKWENRIKLFHSRFQDFGLNHKYDLLVSNPPYFSQSLKNPNEKKTLARHNDSLPLSELLLKSKDLLLPTGRMSLILPTSEGTEFIKMASNEGLNCSRLTKVIPKTGFKEKRLLLEFSFQHVVCEETELFIENKERHDYSQQYKDLTKDFYLKM